MARITVTEERTIDIPAAPAAVYAFFSNPKELSKAMEGVQRCELMSGEKVRWVLAESADQGIRFQPDYVVQFTGDGANQIRWSAVEGNMGNEGVVEITPGPNGSSQVYYQETIEPDLPITPLMARLIRPLVARELRAGLDTFLNQAVELLSSATPSPPLGEVDRLSQC